MASRKEIANLMQGLPIDETWLPTFMERLKELSPEIYAGLVAAAKDRSEEMDKSKEST